jgi:hypothetical protein
MTAFSEYKVPFTGLEANWAIFHLLHKRLLLLTISRPHLRIAKLLAIVASVNRFDEILRGPIYHNL